MCAVDESRRCQHAASSHRHRFTSLTWQWQLHEDSVNECVGIQRAHVLDELVLRDGFWELELGRGYAALVARFHFVAHIRLRVLPLPNDHHCKAGRASQPVFQLRGMSAQQRCVKRAPGSHKHESSGYCTLPFPARSLALQKLSLPLSALFPFLTRMVRLYLGYLVSHLLPDLC